MQTSSGSGGQRLHQAGRWHGSPLIWGLRASTGWALCVRVWIESHARRRPAFDVFAADASPQTERIKRCPRTSPGQWAGSVGVAGPTSCAGHPRLPRTRHFLRGAPQAPAHFLRASRPGGSGTESPCTAGCEPGAASARGHPHSFPARPSTPTASGGDPPSGKSPRQEGAWSWSRLT